MQDASDGQDESEDDRKVFFNVPENDKIAHEADYYFSEEELEWITKHYQKIWKFHAML